MKMYDYVIIGAGIAGSSTAYFLSKKTDSLLLIDKKTEVGDAASGAAGAFLSPLLGKPNKFKDLVTTALKFSTNFYMKNFSDCIDNCGTLRIPKDEKDEEKFHSYKDSMDFNYEQKHNGYFFKIGSVIKSQKLCQNLTKDIEKKLGYEIKLLCQDENLWIINDQIKAKNIILCTGADVSLIDESYLGIRPVWGQRIDIKTKSLFKYNYHKECSVSKSFESDEKDHYIVSIGATHHRNVLDKEVDNSDTEQLLKKASDIVQLDGAEVLNLYGGARASSMDYFPMIGKLIDSSKTLQEYPHMRHGSFVDESKFTMYENLYIFNGVGGRGFVLSPYLANELVNYIFEHKDIDSDILPNRLFKRWVKKYNK
jgi:tRNA 5-methylaminomethyl-2-thiouridine biosynthesis bifunctional protein